jgi:hypothetical protein
MKQNLFALATLAMLTYSCAVPVNTSFERAATLGKGNVEAMGSYSRYVGFADGESEPLHSNFGGRLGVGITKDVDLKIRYERYKYPGIKENGDPFYPGEKSETGMDYISFVPKFSLVSKKLAFMLPLSRYTGGTYSIAPQFLATHTSAKNNVDLTFSTKGDFLVQKDYDLDGNTKRSTDFYLGFSAGAGLSSNLDKWAIRPEVGYLIKPGDTGGALSFGISYQHIFSRKK